MHPSLKHFFWQPAFTLWSGNPPFFPFHWLQNLASGSPSSSLFWVRSARRTSVLSPCLESNMDTGLGISIPSTLFNTTETCWPLWQPLAKSGRLARLVVKAAELSGWLPAALGRAGRSNGTEDGGRVRLVAEKLISVKAERRSFLAGEAPSSPSSTQSILWQLRLEPLPAFHCTRVSWPPSIL